MARTTEALVLHEYNTPFKLEQIKLDTLRPDEALVEIHATGVCHTDLKCATGSMPAKAPAVFGHEGAGIVLETGSDIHGVSPGDKVILSYSFCGTCASCASGDPAYCHGIVAYNFGGPRPGDGTHALSLASDGTPLNGNFFGQSSFARHAIVHRSSLVKVPAETDLELFAPLGCGLQTGAGTVTNTLNVQPGSSFAVFGVGSVGLSALMAAKIRQASTIIAVDVHPARLELARKLGATHTVLASEDVVKRIREICPPLGVKYACDCTGIPSVVANMVDSLGIRGRACTVGSPGPGPRAAIEIAGMLQFGREYTGCHQGGSIANEMIPWLIEQHRQGNYPIEDLITYYNAEDYERAIHETEEGKTIKAVLRWKA